MSITRRFAPTAIIGSAQIKLLLLKVLLAAVAMVCSSLSYGACPTGFYAPSSAQPNDCYSITGLVGDGVNNFSVQIANGQNLHGSVTVQNKAALQLYGSMLDGGATINTGGSLYITYFTGFPSLNGFVTAPISNAGTVQNAGQIQANVQNTGSFTNVGKIFSANISNAGTGNFSNGGYTYFYNSGATAFTNSATVNNSGTLVGYGLNNNASGTINNSGYMSVGTSYGTPGSANIGSITNNGTFNNAFIDPGKSASSVFGGVFVNTGNFTNNRTFNNGVTAANISNVSGGCDGTCWGYANSQTNFTNNGSFVNGVGAIMNLGSGTTFTNNSAISNAGTFNAIDSTVSGGSLTNSGTVNVSSQYGVDPNFYQSYSDVHFAGSTNLNNGVLTGGIWNITNYGKFAIGTGAITTIASGTTVNFSGQGTQFNQLNGLTANNGNLTISSRDHVIAGTFTNTGNLTNGVNTGYGTRTMQVTGTMANTGVLENTGNFEIKSGGTVSGHGDIRNSGAMTVSGAIVAGGAIANTSAFTVNTSGSVAIDPTYQLKQTGSSAVLTVNGNLSADTVEIIDGVLKGSGTINGKTVLTGGSINPGNSPGKLTINGNLELNGGVINLEFAGSGSAQHDILDILGDANFIAGTIVLNFVNGYSPTVGSVTLDSFLHIAGVSTGLDALNYQVSGLGSDYQYSFGANGLVIQSDGITAAVPEMNSWAMMLAGLGVLGFAARRGKLA